METTGRQKTTGRYLQIQIPMTEEEKTDFDTFLDERGLKKGAFTKMAIVEKLARERREALKVER